MVHVGVWASFGKDPPILIGCSEATHPELTNQAFAKLLRALAVEFERDWQARVDSAELMALLVEGEVCESEGTDNDAVG